MDNHIVLSSPWYWAAVAAIGGALAYVIFELIDRGERARFYGPEAVAYTAVCAVVLGLSKVVFGRGPLWAGFPVWLIVGGWAAFAGGHAVAVLAHVTRLRLRHVPRPPKAVLERDPTPEELRTAETYDASWLASDKERRRKWTRERRRRGWDDELF